MTARTHGARVARPDRWRWATLAVLALALGGCGIGLVYPRLDTLGTWYVEGLVSLDDAQADQLDRLLESRLDWHRDSELGRYAAFLRGLSSTVQGRPDAAAWRDAAGQAEVFWRDLGAGLAPVAVALGPTLSDGQVDELLRNLAEQDEEEWEEYADRTPEERVERRQKSWRRGIERYTGRLDPAQRALIDERAAASGSAIPEWREYRRAWREELAATLRVRGDPAQFGPRMTRLFAHPDDWWTPGYRAALERRRNDLIGLLADLGATLTPRQRAAAGREFASLAAELEALSKPGAGRRS
ncbi:MAG: DUF6279 family lipoprotein [Steroidobacteraceae bacterium]